MFPTAQHHHYTLNNTGSSKINEEVGHNKALFHLERTFTLPSRFKKRLLSSSVTNNSGSTLIIPTTVKALANKSDARATTTNCAPSSTDHLSKLVDGLLKSLKHLEMIISKGKYEIISSNATQVLESVLDVYNQLRSSSWHIDAKELYTHKSRVNLRLANLIKWSDAEVLLTTRSESDQRRRGREDCDQDEARLIATSSELIDSLADAINDLVKFCQRATVLPPNNTSDQKRMFVRLSDESSSTTMLRRGSSNSSSNLLKRASSIDDYNESAATTTTKTKAATMKATTNGTTSNKSRSSSASPFTSCSKSLSSSSSINTTKIRLENDNTDLDDGYGDEEPATTVSRVYVDDKTGARTQEITKTLKLRASDPNTDVTQTTTITRTTTSSSRNELSSDADTSRVGFNLPDLRAFFDFEKLAQDLSEIGVMGATIAVENGGKKSKASAASEERKDGFTNEKCNLLVERFESFAKQLQKREKQERESSTGGGRETSTPSSSSKAASSSFNSSNFSTLDSRHRSRGDMNDNKLLGVHHANTPATMSTSPSTYSSPARKITTLYSNSTFKHDLLKSAIIQQSMADEKGDEVKNTLLSSSSDTKLRNKESFVETSRVRNAEIAKLLLDLDLPRDEESTNFPVVVLPNNTENEATPPPPPPPPPTFEASNGDAEVVVAPAHFDANNLDPKLLLIDDEEEDNESESDDDLNTRNLTSSVANKEKCEDYTTHEMDDDEEDDMNDYSDGIKIKNEEEDVMSKQQHDEETTTTTNSDGKQQTTTSISSNSSLSLISSSNGGQQQAQQTTTTTTTATTNNLLDKTNEARKTMLRAAASSGLGRSSISNLSSTNAKSTASANSLSINTNNTDNLAAEIKSNRSLLSEDKALMHSSFSVDSSSQSAVAIDIKDCSFLPKPESQHRKEESENVSLNNPVEVTAEKEEKEKLKRASKNGGERNDYLGLLDITHLLEYQSQSQLINGASSTSNMLSSSASANNGSTILRGGHVDALIVLATSANSSVIAPPTSTDQHSSSHTLNTSQFSNGALNQFTPYNHHHRNKKSSFLFQEAFLTTYRTIIEPIELVRKLIHRYRLFAKADNSSSHHSGDATDEDDYVDEKEMIINRDAKFDFNRLDLSNRRHKMAFSATRNSLTLLIRVLDGLDEMDKEIVEILSNFVFELIVDEELAMARLMRKKLLNKLEKKSIDEKSKSMKIFEDIIDSSNKLKQSQQQQQPQQQQQSKLIPYLNTFTKRNCSLLDFKSNDVAEQMTLIDSSLFRKIELVEVLLWSTKQNEANSPNLIRFTEHFNNISYWARSRILEHENYKDREKYLLKFLRIMKHLRKLNNFNSYLAILSAVDSGPIQRLDWPRTISETIKEFSVLIDPKCGFKSLREAVSEAQPPCIPHIGLILQDLTILHIANSDFLPSGNCNFWKRWQQYNILERLRCFKRCNYDFKPNAKIQEFFNNFIDYINEDAQYNLSEQLKPRLKNN